MDKLADAMGISRPTVYALAKKKGCPGKGPEGYDLEAWKKWHDIIRIKANRFPIHGTQERGKTGPNAGDEAGSDLGAMTIQELRKKEAALKIAERQLKIAKLNGENIPKETVVLVLGKFVSELKTRLVAMKAQAPRLALMTDVVKIEQLLDDNITAAMDGVSRLPWKPDNTSN